MEKLTSDERLNYLYAYCKFDDKPLYLDFWQEDFITSTKQFIAILKSRRTGFSFSTALKGLSYALDPGRQKFVKQFVSYNESDALEKIRYAREFYESIPKFARKPLVTDNKTELEFLDANGKTTSRLISMPCRPPRGKGGSISLDEFGIFTPKMSKDVYTAALYVIARGGSIEVGSTPLGCIGRFYEICTDKIKYPSYQRFNVAWWFSSALCKDVENAVKNAPNMNTAERVELYATDTLKEIFNNDVLEDFQQECECMFVDSSESYITLEEIYSCTPGMNEDIEIKDNSDLLYSGENEEVNFNKELKIYNSVDDMCTMPYDQNKDGVLYIGYDVAKKRDATSIFVLGKLENGIKKVYGFEELRAKDFEFQIDCIRRLLKTLPIRRVCLDSTGMGLPICERLEKEFGDKIEGITFNSDTKEEMAQGIKIGLQRKEFLLPNDKNLHHQIHSIRRIPTVGGHFRYDADRDENGHADSFWAFALANMACSVSNKNGFYQQREEKRKTDLELLQKKTILTAEEIQKENIILRGKSLRQINKAFNFRN